ncbi:AAA family ATPase [Micromonospora halotolerans]
MSGAGKTTLLTELSRRGYETVDTDYDSWTSPDGDWEEPRMAALLADRPVVVVSGTVANQGHFYDRFDHVVLLTAPLGVLLDRVAERSTNPYGKTAEHRAEIARYVREVEPLLRRGATLELDGQRPVGELADIIEQLLGPASRPPGGGRAIRPGRPAPAPPRPGSQQPARRRSSGPA